MDAYENYVQVSFLDLTDNELDQEYSKFDFDVSGFRDAICELTPSLGVFDNMLGWPLGEYDYAPVIRLIKRLARELDIMVEEERLLMKLRDGG